MHIVHICCKVLLMFRIDDLSSFFLIFIVFLLIKISFPPICKWNFTKSNNFTDRFWWSRDLKIKWEKIFWPLGVINRCLRPELKKRFEGSQRTVHFQPIFEPPLRSNEAMKSKPIEQWKILNSISYRKVTAYVWSNR